MPVKYGISNFPVIDSKAVPMPAVGHWTPRSSEEEVKLPK